ncbi:MAG: bifunctional folylpolyglutamate synthase/dihydrofolate synthase [Bacteroidetes bacterium]|nr:MAG: bifunctional folylpolyglutamate synthase/dihydrofolate synthase [Bacteroidota bacterium]
MVHHWQPYSTLYASMLNNSYKSTVEWLFTQFPSYQVIGSKAYKPTLDNVLKLSEQFGYPEKSLKFIHVAGSNGKGSVSSMLASILKESGVRVGLFTSPHIRDFRERIRTNGEMISEEEVIDFVERVKNLNLDFSPSFFEITFVLALLHFKNQNVDICVIETGLGGRLDATNIIDPICSIITSISLEHTQILGDTIEQIAFEKAGIIKQNRPVFVSSVLLPEANEVIQKRAELLNSELSIASPIDLPETHQFSPDYQRANFGLVVSVIDHLCTIGYDITNENIKSGIVNLSPNSGFRGRMQLVQERPKVYLDVSHNPDGIEKTILSLIPKVDGRLLIIYGSSNDKDLTSIASVLPKEAIYLFTTFNHPRSANLIQLKEGFSELNAREKHFFIKEADSLDFALSTASQEDTILVIGSFFLLEYFFDFFSA